MWERPLHAHRADVCPISLVARSEAYHSWGLRPRRRASRISAAVGCRAAGGCDGRAAVPGAAGGVACGARGEPALANGTGGAGGGGGREKRGTLGGGSSGPFGPFVAPCAAGGGDALRDFSRSSAPSVPVRSV